MTRSTKERIAILEKWANETAEDLSMRGPDDLAVWSLKDAEDDLVRKGDLPPL